MIGPENYEINLNVSLDVAGAISHLHSSGYLHSKVSDRPDIYLHKNPHLAEFLRRIQEHGKKVNEVMKHTFIN